MRVRCERCEKATYKGCGQHVEQVLRGVDEGQRCRCAELAAAAEPPTPSLQERRLLIASRGR